MSAEIEGGVRFHIAADLTPGDMSSWSPERIAEFFDGVRQIVETAAVEPQP